MCLIKEKKKINQNSVTTIRFMEYKSKVKIIKSLLIIFLPFYNIFF